MLYNLLHNPADGRHQQLPSPATVRRDSPDAPHGGSDEEVRRRRAGGGSAGGGLVSLPFARGRQDVFTSNGRIISALFAPISPGWRAATGRLARRRRRRGWALRGRPGEVKSNSTLGFFGAAAVSKPTVTGSRGGNAALASLLTALANLGLITDSTTAWSLPRATRRERHHLVVDFAVRSMSP